MCFGTEEEKTVSLIFEMVNYHSRSQQLVSHPHQRMGSTAIPSPGLVFSSTRQYFKQNYVKQRALSISISNSDLNRPLHVETSVEYDLPSHIYPPKNAEPILMIKPGYTKRGKIISKQSANSSLGNFLVSGSSPGHGSSSSRNDSSSRTSTQASKRTTVIIPNSNNCYTGCYSTNSSPSVYNKSISYKNSTNPPEYTAKTTNSKKYKGKDKTTLNQSQLAQQMQSSMPVKQEALNLSQSSVAQHQRQIAKPKSKLNVSQQQHYQEQQQRLSSQQYQQQTLMASTYPLPPPSYATATGLYGPTYRQPNALAGVQSGVNTTPLVGSVVPSEMVPQIMSSAHIVRSRGSPKVRATTRRHHAVVPEYHMKRPRSNTVGAQSGLSSKTPSSIQQQQHHFPHEMADIFKRKQQQEISEVHGLRHQLEVDAASARMQRLDGGVRQHKLNLDQIHRLEESLRIQRHQNEHEESKERLQKVSAVPYIFEGKLADTPHMTSAPLTPAEMMDQDPHPRSLDSTTTTASELTLRFSQANARYFPIDKALNSTITSASTISSDNSLLDSSNLRLHNSDKSRDRNNNYWNLLQLSLNENESSRRSIQSSGNHLHQKSSSLSSTSSFLPELNNLDQEHQSSLWRNFSNILEEAAAVSCSTASLPSPKALNLTNSPKFSPSTSSMLTSQLFIPTPPMSNLATPSKHFSHPSSANPNFMSNIYQLSTLNPPIYNLAY